MKTITATAGQTHDRHHPARRRDPVKVYAVIHDSRLISLHTSRDEAKHAALTAATTGVKYSDHAWAYQEGGGERCEVRYKTGRRWISSGYFVDLGELP